jgi:hypothetical protein
MLKYIVVAASLLLLSGCGEPKLDGSSEEAMKKSAKEVAEHLPADRRSQFESDLNLLALSKADVGAVMRGERPASEMTSSVFRVLDGKTAAQVSSEAAAIRADKEKREREQAIAEIVELKSKRSASAAAQSELAKFEVTKSRFYQEEQKFSVRPRPVVEIEVKNGTGSAVSRAYFKGTIASPGRAVPWLTESFNYEISGGIEPGESQAWKLSPDMFGKWANVKPPKDAVFTVEVTRLDGPDKKALFGSEGFTSAEQERLDLLNKRYPN